MSVGVCRRQGMKMFGDRVRLGGRSLAIRMLWYCEVNEDTLSSLVWEGVSCLAVESAGSHSPAFLCG